MAAAGVPRQAARPARHRQPSLDHHGRLVTPNPPAAPDAEPPTAPARPDRPPAPLTVDDALYRAIAVLGAMCFATLLLTVVGLLIKAAL